MLWLVVSRSVFFLCCQEGIINYLVSLPGLSGNLVGISINLCKSIQKELFINDTP